MIKKLFKRVAIVDEIKFIIVLESGAGEDAIIRSGYFLTKNVDPFSVMDGNSAREIGEKDGIKYFGFKEKGLIYLKSKFDGYFKEI